MANTFELIESTTLGSAQSSVTIGSGGTIPQTYTDLCVKMSIRGTKTGTGEGLFMSINGLTTNRSWKWIYGAGSGSGGSSGGSDHMIGNMTASSSTSNTFSNIELYIPNYASTSQYKTISVDTVDENNATSAFMTLLASLWSSNSAITSLTFAPEANNFDVGSSFYLYGVKNA